MKPSVNVAPIRVAWLKSYYRVTIRPPLSTIWRFAKYWKMRIEASFGGLPGIWPLLVWSSKIEQPCPGLRLRRPNVGLPNQTTEHLQTALHNLVAESWWKNCPRPWPLLSTIKATWSPAWAALSYDWHCGCFFCDSSWLMIDSCFRVFLVLLEKVAESKWVTDFFAMSAMTRMYCSVSRRVGQLLLYEQDRSQLVLGKISKFCCSIF